MLPPKNLSEDKSMAYQYEPLDLKKAQIRLLSIDSMEAGTITCRLSRFDLDNCPEYRAVSCQLEITLLASNISYTWGENPQCCSIQIDGQEISVGESLYQFLEIMRDGGQHLLWIDQICIDQTRLEERNHQVRLMHQIYTRAFQVLAWLGPSAENSDEAMRYIANAVDIEPLPAKAIIQLVRRAYWSRLWILQEIILAKDVVLLCGQMRVQWDSSQNFFHFREDFIQNFSPAFNQARAIVVERSAEAKTRTLLKVLRNFAGWKCRDMRDKVYGLLGLVNYDIKLTIDYKKTVKEVFFDVLHVLYEDINSRIIDSHQRDCLSLTMINTSLHLRRNLRLFSVGEEDVVRYIRCELADLWEAAHIFAKEDENRIADTCDSLVYFSLLEIDSLGSMESDADILARRLSKPQSFNIDKQLIIKPEQANHVRELASRARKMRMRNDCWLCILTRDRVCRLRLHCLYRC
jgi:hypothetical protein